MTYDIGQAFMLHVCMGPKLLGSNTDLFPVAGRYTALQNDGSPNQTSQENRSMDAFPSSLHI